MGVLDVVLTETGSQLGISNNSAGSVLAGLLSLINRDEGGLGGFLDRFRRAGVGNLVSSWLSGDERPVTPDAVEHALGHDTIVRIGSKAGLSFSMAASALALMIPKLIQRLAPGGAVPSRLSSEIASYLGAPATAVASGARNAASAAESVRPSGLPGYFWPLLTLLAAGVFLALWFVNRGPSVATGAFNVEEQMRLASARAVSALAALRPGFTAQDLVNAVNLNVINFATGSAQIPAASQDFLNKTAAALKTAPAGTVIEIGGHTDSAGDPSANLQLSQQRADAVRTYLVQQGVGPAMLNARGYGDTRPLAPNDTEAGRFRNRRIEFSVQ